MTTEELQALSPNDLDELLAQNPNDETVHAEYQRRGINPETGELLGA